MNSDYFGTNGQKIAVIHAGHKNAPKIIMVHGGPGYHWFLNEIEDLGLRLAESDADVNILATQGRGCGFGDYLSYNPDLTDDNLIKRAEDLQEFGSPDILLGHSTGAMIVLTAVMEGFIKPKKIVLVSPYTASLGEHAFWVTEKAEKYPQAFKRLYGFVAENYRTYIGEIPEDFSNNLYINWGRVFSSLKTEDERLMACLRYLDFHVISAEPATGCKNGEPYNQYFRMAENISCIKHSMREVLLRLGTINAHWWCTNFTDGYPFIEKLNSAKFGCPIYIISGRNDDITPPQTVERLAEILNVSACIADDSYHLPEKAMPGKLKENVIEFLVPIIKS